MKLKLKMRSKSSKNKTKTVDAPNMYRKSLAKKIALKDVPRLKLRHDDALERLRRVDDCTFHSMVVDLPAGVMAVGSKSAWDHDHGGRDKWIAWIQSIMSEAFRTLRPGSYSLCWTLPKQQHWSMLALENAGFEIVDCIAHVFGRSLLKGQDASKAIDNLLGLPRRVVGKNSNYRKPNYASAGLVYNASMFDTEPTQSISIPWNGYRTNLKPAHECWILVRKPHDGTVAENILKHDVGAVRVGIKGIDKIQSNVVFSHARECTKDKCIRGCAVRELRAQNIKAEEYFRSFWFRDKLSQHDRKDGNPHSTPKSTELMRWIVDTVCPPGGYVLDPMMGSGSTGVACLETGRSFYGIEIDKTYFEFAKQRLSIKHASLYKE